MRHNGRVHHDHQHTHTVDLRGAILKARETERRLEAGEAVDVTPAEQGD